MTRQQVNDSSKRTDLETEYSGSGNLSQIKFDPNVNFLKIMTNVEYELRGKHLIFVQKSIFRYSTNLMSAIYFSLIFGVVTSLCGFVVS